ncbi:uncharacterized protein LOC125374867 [Haliotis rufescens]|uniref:uncharacterized protein LOC125374867 n=1 Tax=Haliotis rufescens TaxID=6454 RepID=UPI00201FADB9|nr:uncharacterized protein LOC125374867 [Haliotis rufescens]
MTGILLKAALNQTHSLTHEYNLLNHALRTDSDDMSETSRMDPTQLSILLSVIVYHNVNAHNIITCGIRTLSEFASRRVTEGMVWSLEGVDTRVHCVVLCMQDPQCITAGYSPDGGQCRGYNVSFTSPANVTYVTDPGANMFLTCRGEATRTCGR